MASFEIAYKRTLAFEDEEKVTNDPDDPGGRTKFGIAENYWPRYWAVGTPDRSDAFLFYGTEFWIPMEGDRIDDQLIANEIFDTAVNAAWQTPPVVGFSSNLRSTVATAHTDTYKNVITS